MNQISTRIDRRAGRLVVVQAHPPSNPDRKIALIEIIELSYHGPG